MGSKAIALQGIGFGRAAFARQGYGSASTVVTPPTRIRFAPSLYSSQVRVSLFADWSRLTCIATQTPYHLEVNTLRLSYSSQVSLPFVAAAVPLVTTTHMTDFSIKKGNTLPQIESTLKYSTGQAVDLTDALSVEFIYKPIASATPSVIRTGTILNRQQGKVAYKWVVADTTTPGDYQAEWRITFAGGGQLSIPNDESFISFKINPGLV